MDILTAQQEIELLKDRVVELERTAIQLKMEANTVLYLLNVTGAQYYSTSVPSGTPPAGSIWLRDTGTLSTNTVHVYSGSAWIQIK